MPAAKHNLKIEQGSTFTMGLTIRDGSGVPIDITGWTLRGQIRESQSSDDIAATFTSTISNQTTDTGEAIVSLSAADTAAMVSGSSASTDLKSKFYVYDIEAVKPDTTVMRLIQGKVELIPEITR